jgi:hypothetical protein
MDLVVRDLEERFRSYSSLFLDAAGGVTSMRDNTETSHRIIRCGQVIELTQLSRSTIWRLEQAGDFH